LGALGSAKTGAAISGSEQRFQEGKPEWAQVELVAEGEHTLDP
jgi:hypothetical protein